MGLSNLAPSPSAYVPRSNGIAVHIAAGCDSANATAPASPLASAPSVGTLPTPRSAKAARDGATRVGAPPARTRDDDGREVHGAGQQPGGEQQTPLHTHARPHRDFIATRQQSTEGGGPRGHHPGRDRRFRVPRRRCGVPRVVLPFRPRVLRRRPRGSVSLVQERELAVFFRPETRWRVRREVSRDVERADVVAELLLGALRPSLHRRVTARRRSRVQM